MNIREIHAKNILTKQKNGFLIQGEFPFTHTLSWAAGCGFGHTYCGKYCYAQSLPNWLYNRQQGETWGDAVVVKINAPELLHAELTRSRQRETMRIFMSSVTDPYQPLERRYRLTRQCLEVFAQFDDVNLLVIQTRSPFVADDFDRIAALPYAWVSMTLETDRGDLSYGPPEGFIRQRLEAVRSAVKAGVNVQVTVSPCMPHTPEFANTLIETGAQRFVVDTFVDGDGSQGERTAGSPFARAAAYNWRDNDPAQHLYDDLQARGAAVGWSAAGFSSINARTPDFT